MNRNAIFKWKSFQNEFNSLKNEWRFGNSAETFTLNSFVFAIAKTFHILLFGDSIAQNGVFLAFYSTTVPRLLILYFFRHILKLVYWSPYVVVSWAGREARDQGYIGSHNRHTVTRGLSVKYTNGRVKEKVSVSVGPCGNEAVKSQHYGYWAF